MTVEQAQSIVLNKHPKAILVADSHYTWVHDGSGLCIARLKSGKPKYSKTAQSAWICAALTVEKENA